MYTPAATVRRLGCLANHRASVCLLLISQKIAKFFKIAPKNARKKRISAISENLFFAEICPPLPRFASFVLVAGTPTLDLRPRSVGSTVDNGNMWLPIVYLYFGGKLRQHARNSGTLRPCRGCVLLRSRRHCSPPVVLRLSIACLRLAECRFQSVSCRPAGGIQSPSAARTAVVLAHFLPLPVGTYRRTTKKFFCQATKFPSQTLENRMFDYFCLLAGLDKKIFLW